MIIISLLLAIISGLLMAAQSPTNTTLSRYVGNMEATTISFAGGSIILMFAVLLAGTGDLSRISEASWWELMGGPYGVFVVLTVTYAIPVLGVALTLTIIMLGQVTMGTIIDCFGWFHSEIMSLEYIRIIGIAVFAIGVIFVYMGNKQLETNRRFSAKTLIIAIISFISGIGSAVQSPANLVLSSHIGQIEATFISFVTGTFLIFIINLIIRKGRFANIKKTVEKPDKSIGGSGIKFWMLLGGAYGSIAIFLNIIATPYLGIALLMTGIMLGQLSGGILVDSFGLFRTDKVKMNTCRYIGIIVLALGVILITLARLVV